MGLREYHRKRDFAITPEPKGEESKRAGRSFVIQKHAASRLHYDFRLEMEGVLKSWAVPKGPSLDPADKRLAMMTEDHPIDYGDFEGIIPEGQYGGGTVLLWDRGTWEPLEDAHQGLRKGALKFRLDGEKLEGKWTLVRIKGRDPREEGRTWLLIKERDDRVRSSKVYSITEDRPQSVATGRTLEEIAADRDRVWNSNRGMAAEARARSPRAARVARTTMKTTAAAAAVPGTRKAPLPAKIAAQLATLVDEPPKGAEWLHEMKFDGYRILARLQDGRARLLSRNGKDWTAHFPTVAAAVEELPAKAAILDGEVAVVLPSGMTSFQALQNALTGPDHGPGQLAYFLFDLIHLEGLSLVGAPLEARKTMLRDMLGTPRTGSPLRYSDHVAGSGAEFFMQACALGVEGIVSKRRDARYEPGRSRSWLKVKCLHRQEFVIGGYTDAEGSRVGLGALLLGVYDAGGDLEFAGKVGTGFTSKVLDDLGKKLTARAQPTSPFKQARTAGIARAHWVRPELVAEVAFTEWTSDGRLRHPSFQGLREDKNPKDVTHERPRPVKDVADAPEVAAPPAKRPARARSREGQELSAKRGPKAGGEEVVAGVRLTHADRVLYPPQGITKRDLARLYETIADWILPHVKGRPLTLVRCPEGAEKGCFYMKHSGVWAPEALRRVKIQEKTKVGEYLVVDDLQGLVSLVQMGILEIHTWNALADDIERPDRVVFDLDPDPSVGWDRVTVAALALRERLHALSLECFVKTTGGKGLHVVVPLRPASTWDESFSFSRALSEEMEREKPQAYTTSMPKAQRRGRILIDYLRNNRGNTSVAAYSTRARPCAPVSAPITWEELQRGIKPDQFHVGNIRARLESLKADPWKGYGTVRQRITAAVRRRLGL
ncbi:MAG TPA: DNA ligase D [Vicinamibacteria bacterium]|nr:DNA ligase D [Vicinamibacteria bacterium]